MAAVTLRRDYSAGELRRLATTTRNANQSGRLLSLAAVMDGMNRTEAARVGGMDRQTLRDWVHRFNERGPDGFLDGWSKGPEPRLSAAQRADIAERLETGPDRAVHSVVRWRRVDLERVIGERFGGNHHERTIGKLLKALGSRISAPARITRSRISARSRRSKKLARDPEGECAHLPRHKPIEIWFQDEARIGQKNSLVRQWAKRGTRPRQPADQRYESAYLFGAICPARGTGAALALPFADTDAMQLDLDEIARTVRRGAHAVLLLDPAGWHTAPALRVPKSITMILLPSRAPELNPIENIWQSLRQTWLSNRVFDTYADIINAACDAWRRLMAQPDTITSIGSRQWVLAGQR